MGGRYGGSGYRPGAGGYTGQSGLSEPGAPGRFELPLSKGELSRPALTGDVFGPSKGGGPSVPQVSRGELRGGMSAVGAVARALIKARGLNLALTLAEMMLNDLGIDPFTEPGVSTSFNDADYNHTCGPRDVSGWHHYSEVGLNAIPGTPVCIGVGSVGETLKAGMIAAGVVRVGSGSLFENSDIVQFQVEGWSRKATAPADRTTVTVDTRAIQDEEFAKWLLRKSGLDRWKKKAFGFDLSGVSGQSSPGPETGGTTYPGNVSRPDNSAAAGAHDPAVAQPGPAPSAWDNPAFEVTTDGIREIDPPGRPSRGGVKQVKPRGYSEVKLLMGEVTDVADALECMWKSIPKKDGQGKKIAYDPPLHEPAKARYFDGAKGKWVTRVSTDNKGVPYSTPKFSELLQDLGAHYKDVDYSAAVDCQVESILKDVVIGKTANLANQGFLKFNPRPYFGVGTGPAL